MPSMKSFHSNLLLSSTKRTIKNVKSDWSYDLKIKEYEHKKYTTLTKQFYNPIKIVDRGKINTGYVQAFQQKVARFN